MFTTGVDGEPGLIEPGRAGRRARWTRPSPASRRRSPGGATTGSSASPRCRATRSAPASSSRWPATCGCSADDAQLSMRETSLGLVPDLGGTKPLVDLVGYARALEICATGRWVGAAEAAATGLAVARRTARRARRRRPRPRGRRCSPRRPAAVRATKALLRGAGGRTYDEQRAAERAAQAGRLRDLAKGTLSGPRAQRRAAGGAGRRTASGSTRSSSRTRCATTARSASRRRRSTGCRRPASSG